jgi:hypothetical protein
LYLIGLALFVALSVTDFALTYALIQVSGGAVYEANPVAAVWLEQYGWNGLAGFKAATVVVFLAAVATLARRSRWLATWVAACSCTAVLLVNLHSHQLLASLPDDPADRTANVEGVVPAVAVPQAHFYYR